jgi:hypothetical protein
MSIERIAIESSNCFDQAAKVQAKENEGFIVASDHITCVRYGSPDEVMIYTTYMTRDTATATLQKNGVYLASLMEVLEKRVKEAEDRIEVLEATADTDDVVTPDSIPVFNPFGTLIGWIGDSDSHYARVIDEIIAGEQAGSAS